MIDFSDTFMVHENYYDQLKNKRKPRRGDVLYTVTGSFGIPVLVEHDRKFCFQRHIGLIRPDSGVNSKWLYYFLLSPSATAQAESCATGAAQRTVSLTALRKFRVPMMSLPEQVSAVRALDEISAATQTLDRWYRVRLTRMTELRQSILQKAFSGKLTAKEAEKDMAAA